MSHKVEVLYPSVVESASGLQAGFTEAVGRSLIKRARALYQDLTRLDELELGAQRLRGREQATLLVRELLLVSAAARNLRDDLLPVALAISDPRVARRAFEATLSAITAPISASDLIAQLSTSNTEKELCDELFSIPEAVDVLKKTRVQVVEGRLHATRENHSFAFESPRVGPADLLFQGAMSTSVCSVADMRLHEKRGLFNPMSAVLHIETLLDDLARRALFIEEGGLPAGAGRIAVAAVLGIIGLIAAAIAAIGGLMQLSPDENVKKVGSALVIIGSLGTAVAGSGALFSGTKVKGRSQKPKLDPA